MNLLTQRARPGLLPWLDVMGSFTVSDSRGGSAVSFLPGKMVGNPASLQVAGVELLNPWFNPWFNHV